MNAVPWAVLLSALLTLRYLHWRVSDTLNLSGPWVAGFSYLVFAAELWLLAHWLLLLLFSLVPEGSRRSRAVVTRGVSGPSTCLLYTSPSPRDATLSRMPSSA